MLQQTQVTTVIPYYYNFLDRFPTVSHLAQAPVDAVLKLWEGLGYYARARNLHKAAQQVCDVHDGRVPDSQETFKSLPGVGDYICAAVLSIAFNTPLAVVDGNVKRVLARLYCLDHPVNKAGSHQKFQPFADRLLDKKNPSCFNQAMMELGALICTPKNPKCTACPVSNACDAYGSGTVDAYPKRMKSKKVPTYPIAVGVIRKNERYLITQRKPDGLLGGLWEFPGGKIQPGESPEAACVREIKEETGLSVSVDSHLTTVHHAYTHFKIKMEVFCCSYRKGRVRLNGPIAHQWVTHKHFSKFAFPKANLKFMPLIPGTDAD